MQHDDELGDLFRQLKKALFRAANIILKNDRNYFAASLVLPVNAYGIVKGILPTVSNVYPSTRHLVSL